MKGQQLLDGTLTVYAPDTVRIMRHAFDQAWALIEGKYAETMIREAARLRLADAIVDVAPRSDADENAVRRMALDLFLILDRDDPL